MDIGKSFSHVFEDPQWVTKVLIGGLLLFLSWLIVPLLLIFGYQAQLMRNVLAGREQPLPQWSEMGTMLVDGLKLCLVVLIYSLPIIGLYILSLVFAVATGTDNAAVQLVAGLLAATSFCLILLYALALLVVLPAAIGAYVTSNEVGAAFRVPEILALVQRNVGDFLVAALIAIVASFVGALGFIACFIGVYFTQFYAYLVIAHVWAQAYQKAHGGGGPVIAQPHSL